MNELHLRLLLEADTSMLLLNRISQIDLKIFDELQKSDFAKVELRRVTINGVDGVRAFVVKPTEKGRDLIRECVNQAQLVPSQTKWLVSYHSEYRSGPVLRTRIVEGDLETWLKKADCLGQSNTCIVNVTKL